MAVVVQRELYDFGGSGPFAGPRRSKTVPACRKREIKNFCILYPATGVVFLVGGAALTGRKLTAFHFSERNF